MKNTTIGEQVPKKPKLKKGFWKPEEDLVLKKYVEIHGEGKWRTVSEKSGLKRGGRSCRLRWKNYLRPNIKRGEMSEQEKDLIIRLHKLLGNRLPGRTDNEVKNYWNTHLHKLVRGDKSDRQVDSPKKISSPAIGGENLGNGAEEVSKSSTMDDFIFACYMKSPSLSLSPEDYDEHLICDEKTFSLCAENILFHVPGNNDGAFG